MAHFSKKITNIYGVETYQNTKNTYDWLIKALNKGNFPEMQVDADFLFDVSEISCSCQDISEFVEHAFGQADYRLIVFHLAVYSEDKKIAFIVVDPFRGIGVTTDTKLMLERITNLIEGTSLDETEVNDPISVVYIDKQINNSGVLIQGNGNVVANNDSKVEVEEAEKESKFRKFWVGILQNVTSNLIWYLLTLAAGGLLAYFLTN